MTVETPETPPTTPLDPVLDALETDVATLQGADLDQLSAQEELQVTRRIERIGRLLGHTTDRAAAHLHASAAFGLDGHRNVRSALKHLARLSGAEAHGRVQSARLSTATTRASSTSPARRRSVGPMPCSRSSDGPAPARPTGARRSRW